MSHGDGGGLGSLIGLGIYLVVMLAMLAGMWQVFVKAGEPGWAILVPFYNMYVYLKITGKPAWWMVLFFIPLVGAIVSIIIIIELAGRFGKSTAYGLGLIFLPFIFWPMLGLGDAQYQGGKSF